MQGAQKLHLAQLDRQASHAAAVRRAVEQALANGTKLPPGEPLHSSHDED
jgi:hypothetical protein